MYTVLDRDGSIHYVRDTCTANYREYVLHRETYLFSEDASPILHEWKVELPSCLTDAEMVSFLEENASLLYDGDAIVVVEGIVPFGEIIKRFDCFGY